MSFIAGIFLGAAAGVVVMSCLIVAKESDDERDNF